STCGRGDRIRGANMRVRLQPTLALSDDVRVHMTIDVLDNVTLGSSPDRVAVGSEEDLEDTIDMGSGGVSSTSAGDAFRDSIYVRRAWAEVTNRALGQLRFGRMAHEWGLGMLYNAGDGLDDDYSSEIDRVQAITRYSDLFFGASYDFAGEGIVMSPLTSLRAVPFDFTGADDIRQFSFLAAYRLSEEEQEERLANGDWVLNAGIYFLYRTQRLSSEAIELSTVDAGAPLVDLVRRNARQATPDVWAQFMWGDLRLELEAALNIGSIGNITNSTDDDDDYRILSFGFAFQGEYRLLDDALGIYVDTGLGTGDSQVRGISGRENTYRQEDGNDQLTHFGFHPNYRIDLILFRNILGNVGGVWYLRPGLSYDIVRTAFGQRLGARVDVIYSRANRNSQIREYGDRGANTLGLELNASVYYRSEDGPGLTDGFYAAFHYGILFPMAGLKETGLGVGNAQTLRLVLGVEY
nr:TIGR04551 family protein [Deltaproteobacteria bacterium]